MRQFVQGAVRSMRQRCSGRKRFNNYLAKMLHDDARTSSDIGSDRSVYQFYRLIVHITIKITFVDENDIWNYLLLKHIILGVNHFVSHGNINACFIRWRCHETLTKMLRFIPIRTRSWYSIIPSLFPIFTTRHIQLEGVLIGAIDSYSSAWDSLWTKILNLVNYT